jgi:Acyl-CoA dehydrogenase, C-terminal domain
MAKSWIPRRMYDVCHDTVLMTGHVAYTQDHPAQLRLRDILASDIGEGTANVSRISWPAARSASLRADWGADRLVEPALAEDVGHDVYCPIFHNSTAPLFVKVAIKASLSPNAASITGLFCSGVEVNLPLAIFQR